MASKLNISTMNPSTGVVNSPDPQFSPKGSKVENAEQVQPEIYRRGSILHRLKTVFHKPEPSINPTDSDIEAAIDNCSRLLEMYNRLKLHIINYSRHLQGLIITSNTVSNELALAVDDNFAADLEATCNQSVPEKEDNPVKYSRIVALIKQKHDNRNAVQAAALAEQLEKAAVPLLEEQIIELDSLKPRIDARKNLRSETDYYIEKLNKLNEQRLKVKHMSAKQKERLERNKLKCTEIRSVYNNFITQLLEDLLYLHSGRIRILGKVLTLFVQTEFKLSQLVTSGTVSDQNAFSDLLESMNLFMPLSESERINHRRAAISRLKMEDSQMNRLFERSISAKSLTDSITGQQPEQHEKQRSSGSEHGTPKNISRAVASENRAEELNKKGNPFAAEENEEPQNDGFNKNKVSESENFVPRESFGHEDITKSVPLQCSYEDDKSISSPKQQIYHSQSDINENYKYKPVSEDYSSIVSSD